MTSHHDQGHETRLSTSGVYEQEAEQTRRRLAENLDELSDRLSPGHVFDEILSYSRAGSGTFVRAFSNTIRENPLPSLLIGAGCMMFLSKKMGLRPGNGERPMTANADDPYGNGAGDGAAGPTSGVCDAAEAMPVGRMTGAAASRARSAAASVQSGLGSAAESVGRQTSNAADAVADTMRQMSAAVGDSAVGAADAVRGTTRDMRNQASAAADQVVRGAQNMAGAMRDTAASMSGVIAEKASSMSGAVADTATSMSGVVAEKASSMGGAIADTAVRTRRQAAEAVRQGRDSVASLVTEQPLLAAAIGVAIGAALASLLPRTETEDQLMGEASDAMKGSASQVGSEALESAKHVASKVADRAQAAVKEEGFSPSAMKEAARSVGEGIREGAQSGMQQPVTGTGPQEGASGQSAG